MEGRPPNPRQAPLYKFGAGSSRDSERDPCLARVRREPKAAAKEARFGAHFTQIVRFSALGIRVLPNPFTTSHLRLVAM